MKYLKQIRQETENIAKIIFSVFSFKGILKDYQMFGETAIIYSFVYFAEFLNNNLLTYCIGLICFYALLAAIQKRCRDFGSKGTFWVLLATVIMLLGSVLYFMDLANADILWKRVAQTEVLLMLVLCALFFIPSKPEPDMNLRSPLLKYPLLYVAVCWALAIGLTLTISHYFAM